MIPGYDLVFSTPGSIGDDDDNDDDVVIVVVVVDSDNDDDGSESDGDDNGPPPPHTHTTQSFPRYPRPQPPGWISQSIHENTTTWLLVLLLK